MDEFHPRIQFTADATGCEMIAGPVEATAIGNILLQAISLCHLSSLVEGRRLVWHSFDVVSYEPRKPLAVIWNDYRKIIRQHEAAFTEFDYVERFAFYERAKKAYAILATSEMALYANLILKKGIIKS